MSVDYAGIALEVADALAEVKQGSVVLVRVTLGTPPNNWTEAPEVESRWTLDATVKRLHHRYENGTLIIETGDMLMVSTKALLTKLDGDDVTPSLVELTVQSSDILLIDGAARAIDNFTPYPGAGNPVFWKIWSKA